MTTLLHTFFLLQEEKSWLMQSDKVYSVLAVLLIVFGTLIVYLYFTNRKLKKVEEKISELEK